MSPSSPVNGRSISSQSPVNGKKAITVASIQKSFVVGDQTVPVLKNISCDVNSGEFMVISGPSGCGKSTLLHVMLGLEPPTHGKVSILGRDMGNLNDDQKADFRKRHIGMVYQQPHWIKALNVIDNVSFPLAMIGVDEKERSDKALALLKMVQMENWAQYLPTELSSGQQQRISLARALISNPELIIADEPTGNLDYESGLQLMSLLKSINEQTGKTVLMVTHDLEYLKFASRAVRMLDGEIVEELGKHAMSQFLNNQQSKRGDINV